jgi:hypothetical protein
MMPGASAEVTALLKAWRGGDTAALGRLTPLVYDHLRRLGRQYVRKERADLRGDATSLVHEAFIRLVDAQQVNWQDRAHFLAVCSQIMRRLLVDAARARAATKRGGEMQRVEPSSQLNLDAPRSWRCGSSEGSASRRPPRLYRCHRRRSCATGGSPAPGSPLKSAAARDVDHSFVPGPSNVRILPVS